MPAKSGQWKGNAPANILNDVCMQSKGTIWFILGHNVRSLYYIEDQPWWWRTAIEDWVYTTAPDAKAETRTTLNAKNWSSTRADEKQAHQHCCSLPEGGLSKQWISWLSNRCGFSDICKKARIRISSTPVKGPRYPRPRPFLELLSTCTTFCSRRRIPTRAHLTTRL